MSRASTNRLPPLIRQAATYFGVTILLLVLVIYLPYLISKPSDIVALNYFFDTMALSGTALVLANALRERVY